MKIYRMDKRIREELEKEKNINKRIREELAMNYNIKNRIYITKRLKKEINNEIENITFAIENISRKMIYLKQYETLYNNSINKKLLLLIKTLKMIYSDYLRDKEEEL